MLHNPKRGGEAARENASTATEARRLRLEFNKLQRRLDGATSLGEKAPETGALREHVERVARDLTSIRADSVHAVESKLRVALDMIGDAVDEASHKLLSSALSDLHNLAVLSGPVAPAISELRQKALASDSQRVRIKRVLGHEDPRG